jgi:hypothetical protein
MKHEMAADAFLGVIACGRFSHGVVGRRAAVPGVGFDAIPGNHENYPARIFDTGKEVDAVGTGVVGFLENIAEDSDVLVAFLRFDMLGEDLVNHMISFQKLVASSRAG